MLQQWCVGQFFRYAMEVQSIHSTTRRFKYVMKHSQLLDFSSTHVVRTQRRLVLRVVALGGVMGLVGCGTSKRSKRSGHAQLSFARPSHIIKPNALRFPVQMREQVAARALFLINTPYRYGGNSPNLGFDCSGFVQYVFSAFSTRPLPRTARQWAQSSTPIQRARLQRGDLVFFNTSGRSFSHMGIYIGRGRFVHAPSSGKVVSIAHLDTSYYVERFESARTVYA